MALPVLAVNCGGTVVERRRICWCAKKKKKREKERKEKKKEEEEEGGGGGGGVTRQRRQAEDDGRNCNEGKPLRFRSTTFSRLNVTVFLQCQFPTTIGSYS